MEVDDESSGNIAERCGRAAAAHSFKNPENTNIEREPVKFSLQTTKMISSHHSALILTWN